MKPPSKLWMFLRCATALALAIAVMGTPAFAQTTGQRVLVKDIAHVQGVTGNQLVGYGIVVGLQGTGDSTSVIFTSQTIQNVLQSFGLSVSQQAVRTRDVAAVIVTATLPPFAHSGDNADVDVSAMGDASSLQGGTLVLTELRGANNLVYATAQGAVSVGGFVAGFSGSSVNKNYTGAGRIPNGAVIARLAWQYVSSEENNQAFGQPQSFIAGTPTNVQFMVKDSTKYASTGGWGFAQFNDGKPVEASGLSGCFGCHVPVNARDFVFTRYAP